VLRFKEPNTWSPLKSRLFNQQHFPKPIEVHFIAATKKSNNATIIINGSGDMTAFEITFGSSKDPNVASVIGKSNGFITVQKAKSL